MFVTPTGITSINMSRSLFLFCISKYKQIKNNFVITRALRNHIDTEYILKKENKQINLVLLYTLYKNNK